MWAKSIRLSVLVVSVALAGCATVYDAPQRMAVRPGRVNTRDIDDFHRAVALTAELRYDEAAEQFSRLRGVFEAAGHRPLAAESTFWLAYCREKAGRAAEAMRLYRILIARYGDSDASARAARRLDRLESPPQPP